MVGLQAVDQAYSLLFQPFPTARFDVMHVTCLEFYSLPSQSISRCCESHHVSETPGGDGARSEVVVRFVRMDQLAAGDPLLVRRPSLIPASGGRSITHYGI